MIVYQKFFICQYPFKNFFNFFLEFITTTKTIDYLTNFKVKQRYKISKNL